MTPSADVGGRLSELRYAAVLVFLTLCNAACVSSTCDWPEDIAQVISPAAAPPSPDRFSAVTADMTLRQIIDLLGPAVRDIGSGLHILEWQSTDGRIFRANGPSYCERPVHLGFLRQGE